MDDPKPLANDFAGAVASLLAGLAADRMDAPIDLTGSVGLLVMSLALVWGHRPRFLYRVLLIGVPGLALLASSIYHLSYPTAAHPNYKSLANLSNEALASQADDLAHDLMTLDRDDNERHMAQIGKLISIGQTPSEQKIAWNKINRETLEDSYKTLFTYTEKFRPSELAIKAEISRRVIVTSANRPTDCKGGDQVDHSGTILLAGVHPLAGRATCISELALMLRGAQ